LFHILPIMATISLSAPLSAPVTTPLNVGPIAAAAPVALAAAEAQALALPAAHAAPAAAEQAPPGNADGAAMRPDQVFMARQLAWPVQDGAALATSWRSLVLTYATQAATREREAQGGPLPAALLMAAQEARVARQADSSSVPPDPWRFTVHAGGPREQHLRVTGGEPEQQPGRRRRARAALRLELVLDDGEAVAVQVEPLPAGLVMEVCALRADLLDRLRALEPQLEAAVQRSGLRVLRWRYHIGVPTGSFHARMPSNDATALLTLPVFRALAELALLLPLRA
jgi:hypothetical protein